MRSSNRSDSDKEKAKQGFKHLLYNQNGGYRYGDLSFSGGGDFDELVTERNLWITGTSTLGICLCCVCICLIVALIYCGSKSKSKRNYTLSTPRQWQYYYDTSSGGQYPAQYGLVPSRRQFGSATSSQGQGQYYQGQIAPSSASSFSGSQQFYTPTNLSASSSGQYNSPYGQLTLEPHYSDLPISKNYY